MPQSGFPQPLSVDDLVLRVSTDVDPALLNLALYDDFFDTLTRGRAYQREALEAALRFLFGGRYASTAELARENHTASEALRRLYPSADDLVAELPLPDMLACSIDHA